MELLPHYYKTSQFVKMVDNPNYFEKSNFTSNIKNSIITFSEIFKRKNLKIFVIEDNIKKLLYQTKNNIYPRKLPFDSMFIDCNLNTESLNVFGLYMTYISTNDITLSKYKDLDLNVQYINNIKNFKIFLRKQGFNENINGEISLKGNIEKDLKKYLKKFIEQKNNIKKNNSNLDLNYIKDLKKDIEQNKFEIMFQFLGIDNSDNSIFFKNSYIAFKNGKSSILLNEYNEKMEEIQKDELEFMNIKLDTDTIDDLSENIKLFICNFLDFMENPDVKLITYEKNEEHNLKRLKRGKAEIPEYKVIRLEGELKRYLERAERERFFEYSHKFWVRGHFRRYWDKNKYKSLYNKFESNKLSSKYYLDKKYKVLVSWIYPYVKGKGILVDTVYSLKNTKEEG